MALSSRTKKKPEVNKKAAEVEETVEAPETAEAEVETAEEVQTKEVAKPRPAAPPAKLGAQFQLALQEFDNAFENPIPWGTLPTVVANQGTFNCEGESLGKSARVSLISFNDLFIITPNSNDADGSLCGYSYDNHVLNDGSGVTVAEKIRELKEEWPEASSKRYIEVVCMLEDADEDHEQIGEMVTLRLSPQSVKNFERFRLGATVKVRQGKINPDDLGQLKITAKTKTFSKNTFTTFTFSAE